MLLGSLPVLAAADSATPVRQAAVAERQAVTVGVRYAAPKTIHHVNDADGSVTAAFSVKGAAADEAAWSDNFDNGLDGWTVDPTTYVTWTTKQIAAPGDAKSFSAIDPADVKSLFVEGPYQTFRREKSSATSPVFTVPANGMLHFWIGFSLNYDDECRLSLSVSADDFATSEEIWNSKDATGERPWAWRKVELSLEKYAGCDLRLRLTYGPGGKDTFGTGGYLGDFAIDGLSVTGVGSVDHVDLMTGQSLDLVDLSTGNVTSWSWSFPGGVPETSTEKNPSVYYTADGSYDVSLTVTDAEGKASTVTRTAFARVTGTEPKARIIPPATFRNSSNGKYLIAPLANVTFMDGSDGFPSSRSWTFTGVDPEAGAVTTSTEVNPTVGYSFLHDQTAFLEVENNHGKSIDMVDLSVEYSALATNMRSGERGTNFDMGDWGLFPGSNTQGITAFAEKFSRPSRPVMIDGAYVFFTRNDAEEVVDQIANIGVHLYTSKDGKPDKRLDSFWWSTFELDMPQAGSSQMVGTSFPFTEAPIVDDEFFIVIDGLPEKTETANVAFAMAPFRAEGNTAYMFKNGEWIEVSSYFPAGQNHTSFMVYPSVSHSVMAPLTDKEGKLTVGPDAGTSDFEIFSYMGYKLPADIDADWLRLTGEPNGMTVDQLHIAYDALPAGINSREGHITVSDGGSTLTLTVVQDSKAQSGIQGPAVSVDAPVDVYSVQGILLRSAVSADSALDGLPAGLYIVGGRKVANF